MTWTLSRSRAVYAGSYVVAGLVAALVVAALPSVSGVPLAAAAGAAVTVFLFACGLVLRNSGFYDVYWSVAPVVCGVGWMVAESAWDRPRAWLALAVTAAWGLRLTTNWAIHFQGLDHEDWRYTDLRQKTGRAYGVASFFALHVLPFALVTLGTAPLYEATVSTAPLHVLDLVALLAGIAAVAFEAIADRQLHRFRRENQDPARFLDTGLWAYSRHPNYFGEALYWWSIALFGLAARPAAWLVLGAVGVTAMILGASIPMAERRALSKRPSFAEYQLRVSRLVPWPPKV